MIPAHTTPLEAARRARYLRNRADRPDATPAQHDADLAEAHTWQMRAYCSGGYEPAEVDGEAS